MSGIPPEGVWQCNRCGEIPIAENGPRDWHCPNCGPIHDPGSIAKRGPEANVLQVRVNRVVLDAYRRGLAQGEKADRIWSQLKRSHQDMADSCSETVIKHIRSLLAAESKPPDTPPMNESDPPVAATTPTNKPLGHTGQPRADRDEIFRALRAWGLPPKGYCTELRALQVEGGGTVSGFFDADHLDGLADAALRLSGRAPGVYVTINAVSPENLAIATNRVKRFAREGTTNQQIQQIRMIPVDIDSVRPSSGMSATDSEKAAAIERTLEVEAALVEAGVPSGAMDVGDSGNGGWIYLHVEPVPNEPETVSLVEHFQKALAARFDDSRAKIDTSVANPARIMGVPGTMKCKGDSTAERPHRLSRLTRVNDGSLATWDAIKQVADSLPQRPEVEPGERKGTTGHAFDVDAALRGWGAEVDFEDQHQGYRRIVLKRCLIVPSQTEPRRASVMVWPDGRIGYKCHSNTCHGKGWKDARAANDPVYAARLAGRNGTEGRNGDEDPELPDDFRGTEAGNAARFLADWSENVRWVGDVEFWLVERNGSWHLAKEPELYGKAKKTAAKLWGLLPKARSESERKFIFKFATASESKHGLHAMIELAKGEITVNAEDLDRDPWLLNVGNGTLDLRTCALRPKDPKDMITLGLPWAHEPGAPRPEWNAYLDKVTGLTGAKSRGDEEGQRFAEQKKEFLQQAAGYCLTGDTSEEVLFFLYGTGRNGKTKFLETLRYILGPYARSADVSTFLAQRPERVRSDLARLRGARLVTTSEGDDGGRVGEGTIKKLTGGDTITAAFKFKDEFEYASTFKIFWGTNHKPQIIGDDAGIWSRVRLVPFDVFIPPKERDKQLLAKLKKEATGILAWMVEGYRKWRASSLISDPPEAISQATKAYEHEGNVVARFVDETHNREPNGKVLLDEFQEAWGKWASANDIKVEDQDWKKVVPRLLRMGLESKKIGDKRYWFGVAAKKPAQTRLQDPKSDAEAPNGRKPDGAASGGGPVVPSVPGVVPAKSSDARA